MLGGDIKVEQHSELMISVIVPVYNVERYLVECVESIIKQDIDSMEIILIDDGSTDSSGQICDYYAGRDEKITVIHQSNLGVSAARNAALEVAKGKYITFVDSDDVLAEGAYSSLIKYCDGISLIMGQIQLMSETGELFDNKIVENRMISKDDFIIDLFAEKRFPYLGYPVDKLFLRDVIRDNNIRFDEEIRLNEDRLFVLRYILHCQSVLICKEIVYYYRQRSTGVITATRRNATVTDGEMTVLRSFQEMKKICKLYSDEAYYTCSRKAFESALDLLNRVSDKDMEKIDILKKFLRENSRICLENPRYSVLDKMKIIGHSLLRK